MNVAQNAQDGITFLSYVPDLQFLQTTLISTLVNSMNKHKRLNRIIKFSFNNNKKNLIRRNEFE